MNGLIFGLISVVIAAPPTPPTALELNAQGFALYQQGDLAGALQAFNKALEAAPSLPIALYNRSAVTAKLTPASPHLASTLANLETSIALDPRRRARAKADPDFDSLRTTLGFQRLVSAPDTHSVAGLEALLPKLSWWRASVAQTTVDASHTRRLTAKGQYEIEGQPAGTWRVVARPKRDPLVVIELTATEAQPAKTLTGQLLPDGRLVFDDQWWSNEAMPWAQPWVEPPVGSTGADAAQRLIDEALAISQATPQNPESAIPKLVAATEANPRSALAWYELARIRGSTASDPCRDETREGVNDLEAAFALDPTLRERAKTDAQLQGLGATLKFWELMGTNLRRPADVAKLLPKLHWNYGPPSYSDMGWGRFYAFKEKGRFELRERHWSDDGEALMDERVGTWRVAGGALVTVIIDLPASKLSKAQHLVGHLTRDGRLLFDTQWWRAGGEECCC